MSAIVPAANHRWLHRRSVDLHTRAAGDDWRWTAQRFLSDDICAVEAKVGGLGEQLRSLRIARGLKQTVAAERIGRSEHWLVDLEAGKVDPRLSDVTALATLYHTDLVELFRGPRKPRREGPEALTVAIAVVIDGHRVLLVCRRQEAGHVSWQFPAGVVKPEMNAASAAVRETFEETGVHCAVRQRLGTRLHPATHVLCEYFLCDYLSGTVENRDVVENMSVMWVDRSAVTDYIPASRTFAPVLEALVRD
jgi:8-oxo-dGTP pyrophosphatase MutT (NUDIX family)/DNA-binding XRE family transcriptional regulator